MRRLASVAIVVLVIGVALSAEKKPRTWQEGMLRDVSSQTGSRLVGTSNNGHGSLIQKRDDATFYTVETSEYTYVAKRTLTSRGDKQLSLTINDPVKFAIERDDFYLQDDKGKEHKLTIEKKTRNEPAAQK